MLWSFNSSGYHGEYRGPPNDCLHAAQLRLFRFAPPAFPRFVEVLDSPTQSVPENDSFERLLARCWCATDPQARARAPSSRCAWSGIPATWHDAARVFTDGNASRCRVVASRSGSIDWDLSAPNLAPPGILGQTGGRGNGVGHSEASRCPRVLGRASLGGDGVGRLRPPRHGSRRYERPGLDALRSERPVRRNWLRPRSLLRRGMSHPVRLLQLRARRAALRWRNDLRVHGVRLLRPGGDLCDGRVLRHFKG